MNTSANRCLTLALAAVLLTAFSPASAPAEPPSVDTSVLNGAVAPYNPVSERGRFFAAAGVDNELSAEEFAACQAKADKPFARSFDRWDDLLRYDRNGNKTLDWFEADAYRRDLREAALKRFDADGDKRLRNGERVEAVKALRAGSLLAKPAATRPSRRVSPELMKKFDLNGNGKLEEPERRAMMDDMRKKRRQEMLERYDTDGDGELSAEERKAMHEAFRKRHRDRSEAWHDLAVRHFDADGDGELSDAEQAEAREFGKEFGKVFKDMRRQQMDIDGDGEISEQEKQQARVEQRVLGGMVALRMIAYMDADGDGQLSGDERRGFQERTRKAMTDYADKLAARYDADKDGHLSKPERGALLAGFKADVRKRMAKADADADGHLSPKETVTLMETYMHEVGIRPVRSAETPGGDAKPHGDASVQ